MPTSVGPPLGAQLAPSVFARPRVSGDVMASAACTYLLAQKVASMTSILERETDTALSAIAGWGERVPTCFWLPRAI